MQKFINQFLAVILSITCTTVPVSARDNAGLGRTTRGWNEETSPGEIETEPEVTENEEMVSAEEDTPEEQVTEETEVVEEETLPEETAAPEETVVPEEAEAPEVTAAPETEEETVEDNSEAVEEKYEARATEIVSQPKDIKVAPNTNAVFTVEVNGEVHSYQWQMSSDGGRKWTNLSKKTYGESSSLTIKAHQTYDGYLYRVVVKVRGGKNLISESAKLTVRSTDAFDAVAEDGTSIKVDAPVGAFPEGTEMIVDGVTEKRAEADVEAAIKALGDKSVSDVRVLSIGFANDEGEQEPEKPVKVTVEFEKPLEKADEYAVIHINDDGTAEVIEDAVITTTTATFTAKSFSEHVIATIHESTVPIDRFTIEPDAATTTATEIASGNIAANAPSIPDFTFNRAYITVGEKETEVVQVGALTATYELDNGSTENRYMVYYRTPETLETSDLIVLVAGEKITLEYSHTPYKVTYKVNYNGRTYTIGVDELPADLADLEFTGPTAVAYGETYTGELGIKVKIPRGFEETGFTINGVTPSGHDENTDLGDEPGYTLDSNNKIITRESGYPVGELDLDEAYGIYNAQADQVVILSLEKRNSFIFDASYFLSTVYTGGSGFDRMGDSTVNTNSNARITGDGSLGTSGTNKGRKTFTGNVVSWSFTTNNTENSHWLMDSLQINGIDINVPYGDSGPVAKETVLPSGAVVTVTLNSVTGSGRNAKRNYTISVTNVYEDVVISGGNIYNADNSTEIITEVLDNVKYSFYGYSTSDNAINTLYNRAWITWGEGEPIAVGAEYSYGSGYNSHRNYNMYGFNQTNNNAMSFTVPEGYVNPELAYVTSVEGDLHSYVTLGSGLSFGTMSDPNGKYYPINGNPSNRVYYFSITGIGNNNKLALLRIRASLARYGVSYSAGSQVTSATIPAYDKGGEYGDHTLRGYNVEDNDIIVISKEIPKDNNGLYEFIYYTIDGDSSGKTYAPGQKVDLEDVMEFGVYDSSREQFVIPLVAHWEPKAQSEKVTIKVNFVLDDQFDHTVDAQVTKGSTIYVDIDSDTMHTFMEEHDWQLFYDETDSMPLLEDAQENAEVTLKLYSKFYIYHSATQELELHTTKEIENCDGSQEGYKGCHLDKLNITKYVDEDSLYGGYYKDYAGAYVGGENAVYAAMIDDKDNGTLSAQDVKNLSEGGFKVIKTNVGEKYVVNDQKGYWDIAQANTENGMAMTPKRAEIYYLKEVPTYFLNNYYQMTYMKSSLKLTGLYLISAVDDNNYGETGFIIENNQGAKVVESLTFRNTATNANVTLTPNLVFEFKGITGSNYDGYLTYWKAEGQCYQVGTYNMLPYWVTPDSIQEAGRSTRTVNISSMTRTGVSKTDGAPAVYERKYVGE